MISISCAVCQSSGSSANFASNSINAPSVSQSFKGLSQQLNLPRQIKEGAHSMYNSQTSLFKKPLHKNYLLIDCCFSFICVDCKHTLKDNCPVCNEGLAEASVANCSESIMLNAIIEASANAKEGLVHINSQICQRCNNLPAAHNCLKCQVVLCDKCNGDIHSLGVFKKHSVQKISGSLGVQFDSKLFSSLVICERHPEESIGYFNPSAKRYGCEQCYHSDPGAFIKIRGQTSNLPQRRQELEKEQQQAGIFFQQLIEKNNQRGAHDVAFQKKQAHQFLEETFERLVTSLKLKQEELQDSVEAHFRQQEEEIGTQTLKLGVYRDITARNYKLLQFILAFLPEEMVSVEEALIKNIHKSTTSIVEQIQRFHEEGKIKGGVTPLRLEEELYLGRLEEAVRELGIGQEALSSYRSQGEGKKGKKSPNHIISSYQKFTTQKKKRDKSLNNSQNTNNPYGMFKSVAHKESQDSVLSGMVGRNGKGERKDGLNHLQSFDNFQAQQTTFNNVTGTPQVKQKEQYSAPGTALQSQRMGNSAVAKQYEESKESQGNFFMSGQIGSRTDRNAGSSMNQTQNINKPRGSGQQQKVDNSFQKTTTNMSQTRVQKKGKSSNYSNSKQRRVSQEQTSPLFRQSHSNMGCNRDHSSNFRKGLGQSHNQSTTVYNNYSTQASGHNNSVQQPSPEGDLVAAINSAQIQQLQEEHQQKLDQNPVTRRNFTHIAQTSTAIQVAWSHPSNFSKGSSQSKQLQYILQYGIGVKVNNTEQFRQIYKGKAHKCIITDLMPRTTYRFRVAPLVVGETEEVEQGEWSDVTNIATKDNQGFEVLPNHCATLLGKAQKKTLNFEKTGTMQAQYGYSFGEHLWQFKISYSQNAHNINNNILQSISNTNSVQTDMGGIMIVGVVNRRFSNSKLIGAVINYSLVKSSVKVRVLLDANKKKLTVFSPSNPQGEVFTDLPKDGIFYPAVQNKSKLLKNLLKVHFKFEIPVPKDKATIPLLNYSSAEEGEDEDEEGGEEKEDTSDVGEGCGEMDKVDLKGEEEIPCQDGEV